MQFQILDILIIASLIQLILFAFFLLRKRPVTISNLLLFGYLATQIIISINSEIFRFREMITGGWRHFYHIGTPVYFLAAPLFYLFIKSRIYKDISLTKKDWLHIIPFIISVIIFSAGFYFHSPEEKKVMLDTYSFISNTNLVIYNSIFSLQFILYIISSLKILYVYKSDVKGCNSPYDSMNLLWITCLVYGFIIAFISSLSLIIIKVYTPEFLVSGSLIAWSLYFCLFSYIYYKGLSTPELFSINIEKPRYQYSKLSKSQSEEYLESLRIFMNENKPFLEPELTLKELSQKLRIPPRHLSQIINENLQKNFYDFISEYRIEEAKKMLSSDEDKTILEILYSAGFNSKSSFNVAFKKYTGQTPTDFKNSH